MVGAPRHSMSGVLGEESRNRRSQTRNIGAAGTSACCPESSGTLMTAQSRPELSQEKGLLYRDIHRSLGVAAPGEEVNARPSAEAGFQGGTNLWASGRWGRGVSGV